jgi:hypothetical protein
MNALHDKTLDCLNIRFAVRRGRRRSQVLGLRLHGSPAKKGANRIAIRGLAEALREIRRLIDAAQFGENQARGPLFRDNGDI